MEDIHKGYYTVIPATVRYDKNLKWLSIILYGEISALCNDKGYCWATNKYFSELYGVSTRTISECINELESNNHISIILAYKENSREVDKRYIKINDGIVNIKEIQKHTTKGKKFVKPTFEEVHKYCTERRNSVDAQKFVDYYDSKGWLVGKTPMKDWKAAVRTWENNNYNSSKTTNKPVVDEYRLTQEEADAVFRANGWEKW